MKETIAPSMGVYYTMHDIVLKKAASAFSFPILIAAFGGVVQVIFEPRYFASEVTGTGSPFVNVSFGAG